jgi:putative flippase GtrA
MSQLIEKLFYSKNAGVFIQFLRYTIVGGIATAFDVSVYSFLIYVFDINPLIANTFSFTCGLFINYFLSRRWVFNRSLQSFKKDFALFAIIGVLGLGLSNLILFILIDNEVLSLLLSGAGDDTIEFAAKIVATFIVLFWNFFARKIILKVH